MISHLVLMTDQIYSSSPLISFLEAASPLSSCCCSVTQSCPALCVPMDCSTPTFPVLQYLLEPAQTHAIQPSYPLLLPLLPALNLSQHRGLFQFVNFWHQVAKVLELQLQYQSFQ